MCFSPKRVESRREFFRAAARYGSLGMLAAGAAWMAGKRVTGGRGCLNDGLCGGCGVFATCGLPRAMAARGSGEGGAKHEK
jgi:hypothetical protein